MYKAYMSVYEGKKTETLTVKVNAEQNEIFNIIAKKMDRSRSYVVRELALRGLANYQVDGELKTTLEEEERLQKLNSELNITSEMKATHKTVIDTVARVQDSDDEDGKD